MRNVANEGGMIPLIEALVKGTPNGAIEAQEARGQSSFVNSDTLPTDMSAQTKATLETWGVKFLGTCPNDPIFQFVELPAGWKKEPTEHSMWSKLVDENGIERAAIFYKAAFYDRHAHLQLS